MGWDQAKDVILAFMGSGIGAWFVYEMRELRVSVENLNTKLATVLERTTNHEKVLEDHADRLSRIEWSDRPNAI